MGTGRSSDSTLSVVRPSVIWRTLTLKPYGEEMLTSGAATWIFIARMVVFLMASAEAISWGYLGSLFSSGWGVYVSSVVAGGFVFIVIWGLDVTLMTLDRSGALFEETATKPKSKPFFSKPRKEVLGFTARWLIIISSLTITAPFLAQIVFGTDIRKELERQSAATISTARSQIEQTYAASIEGVNLALSKDQEELTDEIAGRLRKGSGLYGNGPVAKSIENRIRDHKLELQELRGRHDKELDAFDGAVADKRFEELSSRWNVVLPESSVIERGKILAQIVQIPTYTKTEWAVRAFLGLLFLALFILKMFEPRSVKIYLSESLHEEWKRYQAGAFDVWLSRVDKSDSEPSAMTPFRFHELMINVYPAVRAEDINRRRSMKVEQDARNTTDLLTSIKKEVTIGLDRAVKELAEVNAEIDQFVAENEGLFSEFEQEKRGIGELEKILKDIDSRPASTIGKTDDVKSIELRIARIIAEGNLREKRIKSEQLEKRWLLKDQRLAELYGRKKNVDDEKQSREAEMSKVETALEAVRAHRLDDATLSIFTEMRNGKSDNERDNSVN
jgi:hypothetical protein